MLGGLDHLVNKQHDARMPKVKTRIQSENREIILDAALQVFSAYGYRGATVDGIAAKAGMSKPNLLYYFRRKEDIYVAVLEKILADWLEPLKRLDARGDPVGELAGYVKAKLRMARDNPEASRLFANEILHGAPMIRGFLSGPLKALVDEKAGVIRGWIAEGKLKPVDPRHLIFAIWATTQHYADFDVQVRAVLGGEPRMADVEATLSSLIINGLSPQVLR
jgi:TetR/AcrR family transcriptional regulator